MRQRSLEDLPWLPFAAMLLLQMWLAHAIGFFLHEYAHSFTAWLLGWKANPLALNYGHLNVAGHLSVAGHLNVANLLVMIDIDENVDYAPIFAASRGAAASLIAVAGVLIGDGMLYVLARWLLAKSLLAGREAWSLLLYWLVVMGVGNFICYVPIRTFTTEADMGTFARGLHLSPWVVLLILGTPFAFTLWQFFRTLLPQTLERLFPGSMLRQRLLVVLTTFVLFVYFGAAGLEHGLPMASVWMSRISIFVLFPLMTALCWPRRTSTRRARPRPANVRS